MSFIKLNRIRNFVLLLAATALLGACSETSTTDNGSGTGSVSLLFKDDTTDLFDQVNVTVDSVRLIGEGPDVYLLTDPASFNLLDLKNCSTLLVANDEVPVGTYSKLRMDVSNIELVKLNPDGSVQETVIPKLPSGRIDLNAQSQFSVAPGSNLVIELDMDANKSIEYHATGSDKYIFRPQVFVNVISDASSSLVRLSGKALDVQDDHFQLCKPELVVADSSCTRVNIVNGTVVMNGDMTVTSYADVIDGDSVLVFGHLEADAKSLNAVRLFDDTTALPSFSGTFSGAIAADAIDFSITKDAPGVTTGDVLSVAPLSLPAIYNDLGAELDTSAIADGVAAQVIGVLLPDSVTPTDIRPGLIIIQTP